VNSILDRLQRLEIRKYGFQITILGFPEIFPGIGEESAAPHHILACPESFDEDASVQLPSPVSLSGVRFFAKLTPTARPMQSNPRCRHSPFVRREHPIRREGHRHDGRDPERGRVSSTIGPSGHDFR